MTRFFSRPALFPAAFAMMLATAGACGAQTMTPADIAPALVRQDMIAGAYEVVHSPKLGAVFVAGSSPSGKGVGVIHVLDAGDLHPLRQIQVPYRAFALALDHESGRLYVGHTFDGALSVIDARSGQILDLVQLGEKDAEGRTEHTRMIEVDSARHRAFVTNPSREGVVWLVDTETGDLLKRVDGAGLWSAGAALDTQAGRFYSSGGGAEEIVIFDARTGERVGTFSTGDAAPEGEDSAHFFVNLSIDVAGRRLFAADSNSAQVYVFDLDTGAVAGKIPVGPGTLDVAFNPARAEVYATYRGATRDDDTKSGGLVVIDANALTVLRQIPLDGHPNSVEVTEDGQALFMTLKAPRSDTHPAWREGGQDSLLRFDLETLLPG